MAQEKEPALLFQRAQFPVPALKSGSSQPHGSSSRPAPLLLHRPCTRVHTLYTCPRRWEGNRMVVRFLCGSPGCLCCLPRLMMSQHSVTLSWILITFACRSRPTAGYWCGCPVCHIFVKKLSVNRVHCLFPTGILANKCCTGRRYLLS